MSKSVKIGAVFYALWGIIHIVGGISLMLAALSSGTEFLSNFGGNAVVDATNAEAIFVFHAFNIAWIGLLVLISGMFLNWKNHRGGYWISFLLAGFLDLGLFVFMIIPGHIAVSEGLIGIGLFLGGFIATTIGRNYRSS